MKKMPKMLHDLGLAMFLHSFQSVFVCLFSFPSLLDSAVNSLWFPWANSLPKSLCGGETKDLRNVWNGLRWNREIHQDVWPEIDITITLVLKYVSVSQEAKKCKQGNVMRQFIARGQTRDNLPASVALLHVLRKPTLSSWAPAITKYNTVFKALTANRLDFLS